MIKMILNDYKMSTQKEIWIEGVLYNSVYGFLGSTIVVAITLSYDIGVLFAYLSYYFFVGKIINRPKYVTNLGKFIVFPIPAALGAFIGYKVTPILLEFI